MYRINDRTLGSWVRTSLISSYIYIYIGVFVCGFFLPLLFLTKDRTSRPRGSNKYLQKRFKSQESGRPGASPVWTNIQLHAYIPDYISHTLKRKKKSLFEVHLIIKTTIIYLQYRKPVRVMCFIDVSIMILLKWRENTEPWSCQIHKNRKVDVANLEETIWILINREA